MLLARYPWSSMVGQKMPLHKILQATTPAATQARSPIDDQSRIVASIELADFPISIFASQTEEAALRNWTAAMLSYSLAAGSSLLLVFVLVLLTQRWRRQELLSEELSVRTSASTPR